MSCEHPIAAYVDERKSPARVIFADSSAVPDVWRVFGSPPGVRSVQIPCGRCFLCRQTRAFDIMVRAVAESRLYDFSSFVTLTCRDDCYNDVFRFGKLCRRPYQLFLKRLRKRIGRFRYLLCGEYGARTGRAHYHLIIYGHRFVDGYICSDNSWCDSRVISDCWPYGNITCTEVTPDRIAYVSGYQLKGSYDDKDFPQFVVWSRRPGLGFEWFRRNWLDMVRNNFTFILHGSPVHVSCRYFFDKLRLFSPEDYDILKASRECVDVDTHIMRHDKNLRHSKCLQYRKKQQQQERLL